MKIGLFGGTFNPPHTTHVNIAKAALEQLALDKLIVMPCGDPPHKAVDVDKATRFKLTTFAFQDIAEVSDYELNKMGKSYTVDTLRHLAELYPDSELYLIIGGDSLVNFGTWYCPKEIAAMATLVVADRGRKTSVATVRRIERDYGAKIVRLDIKATAVNSTLIRLCYDFGYSDTDLVPASVDCYIEEHGLYSKHDAMISKLRSYLTPERFKHTFYVVKRGLELATEDEREKVFTACLLHDCAKYITPANYDKYNFIKPDDMPMSVVHSFLGAEVAKRDFGVTDQEILDAIAYHTTGRPNMTRLDKIVYVADKTEDSRPYPLSHLKKGSLDDMFMRCLIEAYEVCLERHSDSVCPLSEQTIDYYCKVDDNVKCTQNNTIQMENDMAKSKTADITVKTICELLAAKQATDIKIVDISGVSDLADYFVICSGRSIPQVKAIFEHLEEQLEKQDRFAIRKEGYAEGRWIAVDYGDVIVHIFHKDTRDVYSLDTLWNNGSNVTDYNVE
ncbi:MAG: nicotinate (nicotinamide) nucleotide adenylyltransferase [Clostridiales bacterium]|nr:nicotinate (nicotinamide) nucleotide adenylyltransferase [Clostridiales bacterium]